MKKNILITLVFCGALASVSAAAPKPAAVPQPGSWTVDVKFEHPQMIMVKAAGDKQPKRFWYLIMTLTNKTSSDVEFYPKCELMTDTLQLIPAGESVPTAVFEQIKERHQSRYPFLEYFETTGRKILQGQDNAKDVAIVWPDFDPEAKSIKLFIAGLSNETISVDHPTEKDKSGKPVKVFLRKTLELSYAVKGDAALRTNDSLSYETQRWIMR